jgi:hypothetical protein
MSAKKPAFQFYVGDWMKDPALRACSLAARGLWIDMLCLMFEAPRRGYLQQANGQPTTQPQIARMTGCSSEEAAHLLQELEDSGVLSRTEHGVYFSRRMVRDESRREKCAEAGRKGGGNPALAVTYKGTPKGVPKGRDKGEAPPSSSSSSSNTNPPDPPRPKAAEPERPAAWVGGWGEGIQALQAAGVRIASTLADEARSDGQFADGETWSRHVAAAIATAAKAGSALDDRAAGIVSFLRRGVWPTGEIAATAKANSDREYRMRQASLASVDAQFGMFVREARKRQWDDEQTLSEALKRFGVEVCARNGWTPKPLAVGAS